MYFLFQIGELNEVSVMLHVVDKKDEHKLYMVNTSSDRIMSPVIATTFIVTSLLRAVILRNLL